MKSRLAVIMVADVVGYSRMMAEDEEASIVAVRDLNETYVRPHSTNHGGEILKRMGVAGSLPSARFMRASPVRSSFCRR